MKAGLDIRRAAWWCFIALPVLLLLNYSFLWLQGGLGCRFYHTLGTCSTDPRELFHIDSSRLRADGFEKSRKPPSIHPAAKPPSYINPSEYGPPFNALEELHYALEIMQDYYFAIWIGKYPSSIDWTGAVIGTFVSACLFSLTRSLEYILPPAVSQPRVITLEGEKVENEVNKYFSQSVAYYFGEDAFSIRLQAYDDMLWVVLGWLESVRFVRMHTNAHYPHVNAQGEGSWYGQQFVPPFAHRANIFYELASKGWDTKLCGGGMNWNPRLTPYKNAITNELYISASIAMYLYFPGDRNPSPYITTADGEQQASAPGHGAQIARPHDPLYLSNAVQAYDWLKKSNMTNDLGLYVDGFHIAGWLPNGTIGTGNCDVRNEMVYTYNQGVILSGLRGLWEGTGTLSYLEDGHKLVRNVIKATGWKSSAERTETWSGLGRDGILEELCDARGSCSQNGQTFKGIFFHHLTLFCEPLPRTAVVPGKTFKAGPVEASLHEQSCKEYASWVVWNARAAMGTRDGEGRFGMWWGEGLYNGTEEVDVPSLAEDYRNEGLGVEERWGRGWENGIGITPPERGRFPGDGQTPLDGNDVFASPSLRAESHDLREPEDAVFARSSVVGGRDLNDRGRGRTVETQGGGVAVLRSMWEFVHVYAYKSKSK
jgi:hypothetical protein